MSRWVVVKGALGAVGLALGLTGMVFNQRPLVWAAVGFLGAAFLIRFIERRSAAPEGDT